MHIKIRKFMLSVLNINNAVLKVYSTFLP